MDQAVKNKLISDARKATRSTLRRKRKLEIIESDLNIDNIEE